MILRARYVMPSSHELFEDGGLRIRDDLIVEVGQFHSLGRDPGESVTDLADVVLMPGFINAHTHLELGGLGGKLPPPASFADWLRDVIRLRAEEGDDAVEQQVADGARAALEGGTTTIVDVTHTGRSIEPLRASPIRKLVHFEVVGFDAPRTAAALDALDDRLARTSADDLLTVGVSPHAPYSVSSELYAECVARSRKYGLPLCSHVAETLEEEEFVRDGTGPLMDLLESLGVSVEDWHPRKTTPVKYLADLGFFGVSPLLVHGNCIRQDDVPILRDLGITVVYCPRSHAYFGRGAHPFERLFALGVNVALGTDSLASSPSVSVLDEMKFMAHRHAHVSPERILTLGMLNGAKTVRTRAKIGGLRAGWKADIVGIHLREGSGRVAARVLDDSSEPVFTMVNGTICYRKDGATL